MSEAPRWPTTRRVAWTGSQPTSAAASQLAAAQGTGAAFVIEAWAPDDASDYVAKWKSKGFTSLIDTFTKAAVLFGGLPGAQAYHVQRLLPVSAKVGIDGAIGGTAVPAPGIRSAAGAWWAYPSHASVAIAFIGSAADPSVRELNRLALVGVAAFGLAPVRLG